MYKAQVMPDGSMELQGQFGKYKISDDAGGGFKAAPVFDTFVEEYDETEESFLIEKGKEWFTPFKTLLEMNAFLQKCEKERLWNIMPGPMFRFRISDNANAFSIKGVNLSAVISKTEDGFKVSYPETKEAEETSGSLPSLSSFLLSHDSWYERNAEEAAALSSCKGVMKITSGGNLRFETKSASYVVGQRESGTFFVAQFSLEDRSTYFVDTFEEALQLIAEPPSARETA